MLQTQVSIFSEQCHPKGSPDYWGIETLLRTYKQVTFRAATIPDPKGSPDYLGIETTGACHIVTIAIDLDPKGSPDYWGIEGNE